MLKQCGKKKKRGTVEGKGWLAAEGGSNKRGRGYRKAKRGHSVIIVPRGVSKVLEREQRGKRRFGKNDNSLEMGVVRGGGRRGKPEGRATSRKTRKLGGK